MLKRCRRPFCDRPPAIRGVCKQDYYAVKEQIRRRRLTWEEVNKSGALLPPRGSSTKGSVVEWIRNAK